MFAGYSPYTATRYTWATWTVEAPAGGPRKPGFPKICVTPDCPPPPHLSILSNTVEKLVKRRSWILIAENDFLFLLARWNKTAILNLLARFFTLCSLAPLAIPTIWCFWYFSCFWQAMPNWAHSYLCTFYSISCMRIKCN